MHQATPTRAASGPSPHHLPSRAKPRLQTGRIVAIAAALVVGVGFAGDLTAATPSPAGQSPEPAAAAADLLTRAFSGEVLDRPRDGGDLFRRTLDTDLFSSGSVGPFDVHVLIADELDNPKTADRLRDDLIEGLQPAAELISRLWPAGGGGLISGSRLPIVVAESKPGDKGYASLVELLDYCERIGYSGWLPANELDTVTNRTAEVARTWDVQLFNMAHSTIAERRARWVEHGCGYYSLAFVANRALRRGAWGLVPPWLANGLIDELDIAAHERAWVGQESWTEQTPGWYRAGWSGFVPKGSSPPPPVTGPPANLAVTVSKTGDPWLDFDASETRHWGDLIVDRRTEAPASFAYAAETQSFLPRDRAAARCLMHLLLQTAPAGQTFTALLDKPVNTPRDGMPDSEALTVIMARALGGVPEVDRIEALSTRELLTEVGRTDLVDAFTSTGAGAALEMNDHREQSLWLSRQPQFDGRTRGLVFNLFLETEYEQQMAEWRALAPHLDAGLEAALTASKRYPKKTRDFDKVAEAFREGLTAGAADNDDESRGKGSRSSKRSSSRR